jgi:hypothetical protein
MVLTSINTSRGSPDLVRDRGGDNQEGERSKREVGGKDRERDREMERERVRRPGSVTEKEIERE